MAVTPDIADTVRKAAAPKGRKPRFIPRYAVDMGPTEERKGKQDYEDVPTKKSLTRKPSDNVGSLERAGLIPGEAVTAARLWLRDWNMAVDGVVDVETAFPEEYTPGDHITFSISRGNAAERLALIRELTGELAYRWVVFVVAYRASFTSLGRDLWPDVPLRTACDRARSHAAAALRLLPRAYSDARTKQKEAKERARRVPMAV